MKFKIQFFIVDHRDNDIPKYNLELVQWPCNKQLLFCDTIEHCFEVIKTLLTNEMKINEFHHAQAQILGK